VPPHPPYRLADEWLLPDSEATVVPGKTTNPDDVIEIGEIYLELASVDPNDEHRILEFVSRFGVLGVRHAAHATPTIDLGSLPPRQTSDAADAERLDEFRLGAHSIHTALSAWRFLDRQTSAATWKAVAHTQPAHDATTVASTTRPREHATQTLARLLNAHLTPFHPQTLHQTTPTRQLGPDTTLLAICFLELYNHIIQDAHYHTCRHCHRLFVHQRGRAEAGQHKSSGVIYCSRHCAKAAASRTYRARKKATQATHHTPPDQPTPTPGT
jgi:hypothetical protein